MKPQPISWFDFLEQLSPHLESYLCQDGWIRAPGLTPRPAQESVSLSARTRPIHVASALQEASTSRSRPSLEKREIFLEQKSSPLRFSQSKPETSAPPATPDPIQVRAAGEVSAASEEDLPPGPTAAEASPTLDEAPPPLAPQEVRSPSLPPKNSNPPSDLGPAPEPTRKIKRIRVQDLGPTRSQGPKEAPEAEPLVASSPPPKDLPPDDEILAVIKISPVIGVSLQGLLKWFSGIPRNTLVEILQRLRDEGRIRKTKDKKYALPPEA